MAINQYFCKNTWNKFIICLIWYKTLKTTSIVLTCILQSSVTVQTIDYQIPLIWYPIIKVLKPFSII